MQLLCYYNFLWNLKSKIRKLNESLTTRGWEGSSRSALSSHSSAARMFTSVCSIKGPKSWLSTPQITSVSKKWLRLKMTRTSSSIQSFTAKILTCLLETLRQLSSRHSKQSTRGICSKNKRNQSLISKIRTNLYRECQNVLKVWNRLSQEKPNPWLTRVPPARTHSA